MLNVNRPSARIVGVGLVATMVLGSALGAEAATKKKTKKHKAPVKITRTVQLNYTGGCTIDTPAVGASPQGDCSSAGAAGWVIATKPGEKYASVTVSDATGQKTSGAFWEPGGPNGTSNTIPFCGALKNYVVPVGGSVTLALDAVGAVATCPGLATQGTVTVVFSNLP